MFLATLSERGCGTGSQPLSRRSAEFSRSNVRIYAAARIQERIAGPVMMRNTLPPLAFNDLFEGAVVLFRQNLIRLREERRRQVQAQAPGSALVNRQVVSAGIADRPVARARALQDFINVASSF